MMSRVDGVGSPCVLVVDDDPDILAAVEMILETEGYQVLRARNGAEAFGVLEGRRPDLILLDLMMPVMNGWEFRRQLREHPAAATPVVIVSADRDIAQKARSIEADGYVPKPFDLDHLLAEVERLAVVHE